MEEEYGNRGVKISTTDEIGAADTGRLSPSCNRPHAKNPRILIVRLSAMGDLIHGVPVLNALRSGLPEAFIGWVVEGRNADLLEGHSALDQLVRVPRHWWKSPRTVAAMRQELKSLQFDIALDLQSLTKSAAAAWFSGARRRVGFAGRLGRELSRLLNNELVPGAAGHVVDRYLSMLSALEITTPTVRWDFPERDVDARFAETFLRHQHLDVGRFAIFNPAAGWVSKRWPTHRFGELASYLALEQQLPTMVVWGTPSERPLAQQVVDAGGGSVVLSPSTTMTQLASLARRAAIFVGSDTGPLHLAVAVGTPSISLHGTSLATECGAYGPRNRALQVVYDNSRGKRRMVDNSAMAAITTEMVCQACCELLTDECS